MRFIQQERRRKEDINQETFIGFFFCVKRKELAEMFQVSKHVVEDILRNKNYKTAEDKIKYNL